MEQLFNYRPTGNTINVNGSDIQLMVIRKGPRGIISMVRGLGPVVIWDKDNADAHAEDSEGDLIQRTIDVLSA